MRSVDHPLAASLPAPMSVLGFGCSGLLGRTSRKDSLAVLHAALDSGITYFDTARSYGFGGAEGLLGQFLASEGRRERVVVATKFGNNPGLRRWKQHLRPVARAAVRLVPSLREAVQRRMADNARSLSFTVADLNNSLEKSLRELRTSYVDILFLQEAPASVLAHDDLMDALGRVVEQGKVRLAGIAAEIPVVTETFRGRRPVLQAAQFAMNLSLLGFTTQTLANRDLLLIANQPFGGPGGLPAIRSHLRWLREDVTLSEDLRRKLADNDPQLVPELVFGLILQDTGISALVPSITQPEHIQANIANLEQCRFSGHELAELRTRLAANPL